MNRENINDLLKACLKAPNSQLCSSTFPKIKDCINSSDCKLPDKIKSTLDDCARCGLASGFTMVLLDSLWKESKKLKEV